MDASSAPRHDGNGRRSPQPFPSPGEPGASAQLAATPKPSSTSRRPRRTRMPSQAGSTDDLALSPGPQRRSTHARVQRSTVCPPTGFTQPGLGPACNAAPGRRHQARPQRPREAAPHDVSPSPTARGASPRGRSRHFAGPRAPAPHATQDRVATPVTSSDTALHLRAAQHRALTQRLLRTQQPLRLRAAQHWVLIQRLLRTQQSLRLRAAQHWVLTPATSPDRVCAWQATRHRALASATLPDRPPAPWSGTAPRADLGDFAGSNSRASK
jgi:hypothetical protein